MEFERKNLLIRNFSNIIKARSNINRLKYFLFNVWKKGENDICTNCNKNTPETTEHFIMECDKYNKERLKMCKDLYNILLIY